MFQSEFSPCLAMPIMFVSSRSLFFVLGIVAGLVFIIGCETDSYDPLLAEKRMHDLRVEVESLRAELAAYKEKEKAQGASNTEERKDQDRAFQNDPGATSTEQATTSAIAIPPKPVDPPETTLTVAEEQTIVAELENKDAYFEFDEDGFVIEADFKECRSSNDLLERIVDFSRVKKVLLEGTRTDDLTFDLLAKIKPMEYLDIERSNPSPEALAKLKGLPKLNFLQLFKVTLSEEAAKVISGFPHLKQIRCAQTRVGDAELRHFANIKTLRAIDLSDCNRVTPAGLESLAQCTQLTFLKVWGKSIGNESMDTVAKMKSLRVLGLVDTAVDDSGIAKLAGLKLTEVHLFRTSVGDDGVKILAQMPNMKTLNLRDTKISDQALDYIAGLQKLEKLDLSECTSPGVTDAGANSIAKLKNLKNLNLWSTQITDAGVEQLAGLENLTTLNLDATKVTDKSVKVAENFTNLTWIHLGKTKISDEAIQSLKKLKKLKFVSLANTSVSSDAYYELVDELRANDCEIIGP